MSNSLVGLLSILMKMMGIMVMMIVMVMIMMAVEVGLMIVMMSLTVLKNISKGCDMLISSVVIVVKGVLMTMMVLKLGIIEDCE